MISTWHLDTSQVKDMDSLLETVQQFLTSANGNLLVSLHCVQDGKAVQYIDTVEGLTERLQGMLKPKIGFFAGYE